MEQTIIMPLFALVYILIYGFLAYFLISVLRFMRNKNRDDKLLIEKMDEISKKLDGMNKN